MDWNDLRYFLAVARDGSALAAARVLGVNQTTVARRIEALEHALGGKLFERGQTGSRLTELGEALVPAAESVETAARAVTEAAHAHRRRQSGVLRVTTNESLANFAVTPALAEFRRLYPDIRVEVIVGDQFLDLSKGEADIAIRGASERPSAPDLVARRLTTVGWGLYCSVEYARQHGRPRTPEELSRHILIGGEGPLAEAPAMRWMMEHAPNAEIHCRSNSLSNLGHSAKAGLGVAPLPELMAATEPDLICCIPPIPGMEAHLWIVTTATLKAAPRVRAFIDFMAPSLLARARAVLDEAEQRTARIGAELDAEAAAQTAT